MAQFTGKVALVTGASRGLGKAIALELAHEGAQVACVATRAENAVDVVAQITANGGIARAYGCRVEKASEVTATFEAVARDLGPVDILVNNAGISRPMVTLEMTEENWDLHMNINAKSIFLCAQAGARQMKGRGGVIINIGSILGRNAFPATLGYCTSPLAGLGEKPSQRATQNSPGWKPRVKRGTLTEPWGGPWFAFRRSRLRRSFD